MTIKEARLEAGLTQAECAKMLEMPKRTLEEWEEGRRHPPDYIVKLIIKAITEKK